MHAHCSIIIKQSFVQTILHNMLGVRSRGGNRSIGREEKCSIMDAESQTNLKLDEAVARQRQWIIRVLFSTV